MGESKDVVTVKSNPEQFHVALISPPWALFHRPSIQIASLSSYLQEKGGYTVGNHHLYLSIAKKISIETYSRISNSSWAGEAVFTPLLFPEKNEESRRLFISELQGDGKGVSPDFEELVNDIRNCCDIWLSGFDLQKVSLIGFSVCFSQLLPSLYLASLIKKKVAVPIVFGGTSCSGEIGQSLIEQFNQIDFLVDGEGEGVLLELCNFLSGRRTTIPDRIKTNQPLETVPSNDDVNDLDTLPTPYFEPYLEEIRNNFSELPFMPTLPVEFSRGCSWNRCTFCNLNLQWQGYRHKSAVRMITEVKELARRNESLNFSFTDNVLPAREIDKFFKAIIDLDQDFKFFGEIRAKTGLKRLWLYYQAGVRTVQVGIESLSSTLLLSMGKGTTVMDNLAVMKYCSGIGIRLMGNIITEFPGTSEDEIDETLKNLDYVLPYAPLDTASFFLGVGSPIYRKPREYGISAILPHPKNKMIFPAEYQGTMLVSGFRGDKNIQEKRWRPVREKIKKWQAFHRNRNTSSKPPLYYRDGGNYLVIYQELQDNSTLLHRLRGTSRKIYLFCDQPKEFEEIYKTFPGLDSEAIKVFLNQLCTKRLMFQAEDKALALAIRNNDIF